MQTSRPHALKDDDQHRLQCPLGHANWKPVDGHFWCPQCENWKETGRFDEVYDDLTGEWLDRSAVRDLERELRQGQPSAR